MNPKADPTSCREWLTNSLWPTSFTKAGLLVLMACVVRLSPAQPSPEEALRVLQTSLDRDDRLDALRTLQERGTLPEHFATELGRIILAGGQEARFAQVPLGSVGNAAIPVIIKLLQYSDTDTTMNAIEAAKNLPKEAKKALTEAIEPMIDTEIGRVPGILTLGALCPVGPTSTRLTRKWLHDASYDSKLSSAVILAVNVDDESVFQEMQQSAYATIRYAGVRYAEDRRQAAVERRIGDDGSLPQGEVDLREAAEKQLRQLAQQAMRECQKILKTPQFPDGIHCLFLCFKFMARHLESEQDRIAVAQSLRDRAERGTILDRIILGILPVLDSEYRTWHPRQSR